MTLTEISTKINEITNVIGWNNARATQYESAIATCTIGDCVTCQELRKEVTALDQNNVELSDTIEYLTAQLELEQLPSWLFRYAVTSSNKIYDCIVHSIGYQESLNAFTVTHQFECVLVSVVLIAE